MLAIPRLPASSVLTCSTKFRTTSLVASSKFNVRMWNSLRTSMKWKWYKPSYEGYQLTYVNKSTEGWTDCEAKGYESNENSENLPHGG
ncbi:MAG: hypothetical protein ACTS6A_02755 [Candidatus Hodgkinia cicadicola]